jgi:hypothetical protein
LLIARNQIAQPVSLRGINAINFNATNQTPAIVAVTIRDNRIGPVPGGGDAIQAKNTRGLRIVGNEIFGVKRPPGTDAHPDAFQSIFGARDLTIEGNFIHDIAAQGIFLQLFQGPNRGFVARDNVIARVAYPFVAFTFSSVGARVTHNTVDGIMRIGSLTRRAQVIANVATFGMLIDAPIGREDYNLSKNFTTAKGPHSLTGAPQYRNPARNDFALAPGSPGYRAGPDGKNFGSLQPPRRR